MSTRQIKLVAAPTAIQPGGYIAKAYADRVNAITPTAQVSVDTSNGFVIGVSWRCDYAMIDASDNPKQFIDAAALLVPEHADAPWITMGAPGMAVQGVLWRADKAEPYAVRAEGLGSVQRSKPQAGWKAEAAYGDGVWRVTFTLPQWAPLAQHRQFAVAIWQGAQSERAGLKSVSEGWLPL